MDTESKIIDLYSLACATWGLTLSDVKFLFVHPEPISPESRHLADDDLPCKLVGELEMDGKRYAFEVNGGSLDVVIDRSTQATNLFGCKAKCAQLFPFGEYEDEE